MVRCKRRTQPCTSFACAAFRLRYPERTRLSRDKSNTTVCGKPSVASVVHECTSDDKFACVSQACSVWFVPCSQTQASARSTYKYTLIQNSACLQSWDAHTTDEATLSLRLAALQSLLHALPPSSRSYQSEANTYSDITQTAAPHPCTHPSEAAALFDTGPPFYPSQFGKRALFPTNNVSNPRYACICSTTPPPA